MFARFTQITLVALALVTGGHARGAALVYGAYYDETIQTNCIGASGCRLEFSQTPADKLLMVRNIHCSFNGTALPYAAFLQISATAGGPQVTTRQLPIFLPTPYNVGSNYISHLAADTHWLIGQGRFPYIIVLAGNSGTLIQTCTMTGDLVNPL
jgi:hypothetical protein